MDIKNEKKKNYYKAFKCIYGDKVLADFKNYLHPSFLPLEDTITPDKFNKKLSNYIDRINTIKNFYKKNYQYTRFVLITLEIVYGSEHLNFSEVSNFDKPVWEVEHIIPQKESPQNFYKNSLGNLTLLPKSINSNHLYDTSNFKEKKEYILNENPCITELYINSFFRQENNCDLIQMLKNRESSLKQAFKSPKTLDKLIQIIEKNI